MIKDGENKKDKHYQEKAACEKPSIKVDSTATSISNHSRSSEPQTRLNQHQFSKIWGSDEEHSSLPVVGMHITVS